MNRNYKALNIKNKIDLRNGDIIILTEELLEKQGNKVKYESRNIYRIGKNGELIWQIKSDDDAPGNNFVSVYVENGEYRAYRWDGGVYGLDIDKGTATPLYLAR